MEENKNTVPETPAEVKKEKESFIKFLSRKEDEHLAKKAAKAEAKAAKAAGETKTKKGLKIAGGIVGGLAAVGGVALAVLSKKGGCVDDDYDPDYTAEEKDADPVDDPMDADTE